MFHSKAINNKINKLHERALRLVYMDTDLSVQQLATEMYKLKNNIPPMLLKTILPGYDHTYELRSEIPFQAYNVRKVSNGTETIRFRGPNTWAIVPSEKRTPVH